MFSNPHFFNLILSTRKQLTLWVQGAERAAIEQVRQQFNPQQHALIAAHVTLCREDELVPLDVVLDNLQRLPTSPLVLDFGAPIRFDEGKGVLLPAVGGIEQYHQLRRQVLAGVVAEPRPAEPHLTLMHPRNSTCTDDIFARIQQYTLPQRVVFNHIGLIEQEEGQPWQVLREFWI